MQFPFSSKKPSRSLSAPTAPSSVLIASKSPAADYATVTKLLDNIHTTTRMTKTMKIFKHKRIVNRIAHKAAERLHLLRRSEEDSDGNDHDEDRCAAQIVDSVHSDRQVEPAADNDRVNSLSPIVIFHNGRDIVPALLLTPQRIELYRPALESHHMNVELLKHLPEEQSLYSDLIERHIHQLHILDGVLSHALTEDSEGEPVELIRARQYGVLDNLVALEKRAQTLGEELCELQIKSSEPEWLAWQELSDTLMS